MNPPPPETPFAPAAYIAGCGGALPKSILSNEDMAKRVDTSDEWIVQRTGIRQRYIAGEGETCATLALEAAQKAVDKAGVNIADIECVITGTASPDYTFPAVATQVQAGLGMNHGFAFDVQAACSGFIYAMANADALIRAGQVRTCLVIGADTLSRVLDWEDRSTCVLFGDGAGACVLRACGEDDSGERGIIGTRLFSDGNLRELLFVDGGPSTTGTAGKLRMRGKEVFRHGVNNIAESAEIILNKAGIAAEEIDWFVPHQANQRIIDGVARKLGLPPEKTISTVAEHANTSAASIPLALVEGEASGRIKRGDLVLMGAMGGGLTWGALLVRW